MSVSTLVYLACINCNRLLARPPLTLYSASFRRPTSSIALLKLRTSSGNLFSSFMNLGATTIFGDAEVVSTLVDRVQLPPRLTPRRSNPPSSFFELQESGVSRDDCNLSCDAVTYPFVSVKIHILC